MSKIDILLILPPCWDIHFPPLGISYLSAYLKTKGYRVEIFDVNIDLYHRMPSEEKKWWLTDKLNYWSNEILFQKIITLSNTYLEIYVDKILSSDSKIIGFSIYDSNRLFAIEIAKRIKDKAPDTFIIFGGPGCCNAEKRSRISSDIVDIIVVGEGEEALLNIISQIGSGKKEDLTHIISYPSISDINYLPFPTFGEFDLKLYIEHETLPILMSRGCIGRCTFCNDHYFSRPFRYRNAKNVVNEIKEHINRFGVTNFGFQDLAINGNVGALNSFCQILIEQHINITWTAQAIPYEKMTQDLLKTMHSAGCTVLIYGLESASNKILCRMGKFFTKETAKEVIRNTYKANIKVFLNIIVGFPGETGFDFKETVAFIKYNHKYIDAISSLNTCCINNDTELERLPDEYGIILSDNPKTRALYWQEKNGPDYNIRRQRVKDLSELLKNLHLTVNQNNLYDVAP
jgi:radical SAM superfamily enzyme YgiQ (UPF0313 family)